MRTLCTLAILIGLLAGTAAANPELRKIQAALAKSKDPAERAAYVPQIVQIGGSHAARILSRLTGRDGDLTVRIAAAKGLGEVDATNATDLVLARVVEGGPRLLRHALRVALRVRNDGSQGVLDALGSSRDVRARALYLEAMQALRDPQSLKVLLEYGRGEAEHLRLAAISALAKRRDRQDQRMAMLARSLIEARATPDVLQLLDVLDGHTHNTMKPALKRYSSSLEPAVRESAEFLLRQLEAKQHMQAKEKIKAKPPAADKQPNSRYADPKDEDDDETEEIPPVPIKEVKARLDMVFAFDASGSAGSRLREVRERIRMELETLVSTGASMRVGVVVFRGGRSLVERKKLIDVLPLTYDLKRVQAFIAQAKPHGSDDRGAAIAPALREALDRMLWRWRAQRTVRIIADSGVDDRHDAARTVRQHFQADRTRTRVTYILRTRTRVPEGLDELARLGGSSVADRMK